MRRQSDEEKRESGPSDREVKARSDRHVKGPQDHECSVNLVALSALLLGGLAALLAGVALPADAASPGLLRGWLSAVGRDIRAHPIVATEILASLFLPLFFFPLRGKTYLRSLSVSLLVVWLVVMETVFHPLALARQGVDQMLALDRPMPELIHGVEPAAVDTQPVPTSFLER